MNKNLLVLLVIDNEPLDNADANLTSYFRFPSESLNNLVLYASMECSFRNLLMKSASSMVQLDEK